MNNETPQLSNLERQALAEGSSTTRFEFLKLETSGEYFNGDEEFYVCHFREKGSEARFSFECRQTKGKKIETFPCITVT